MKIKLFSFCIIVIVAIGVLLFAMRTHKKQDFPFQCTSYWFSWSTNNKNYILRQLQQIPAGFKMIMVAFALEKTNNQGIELQLTSYKNLKADLQHLQQKGTKVLLSTGGARGNYPWANAALTDEAIAKQYIDFIKQYPFDGIDFDIERDNNNRLPAIIALIKKDLPNLIITMTVSTIYGKGIGDEADELARKLFEQKTLNYIYIMNYNNARLDTNSPCTYDTTELESNCYIHNVLSVKDQIARWTKDDIVAKQLIINGIMIGYDDMFQLVSVELAAKITEWLKENQFAGVMTWGLNRDQPAKEVKMNIDYTTGVTEVPMGAYTESILKSCHSKYKNASPPPRG